MGMTTCTFLRPSQHCSLLPAYVRHGEVVLHLCQSDRAGGPRPRSALAGCLERRSVRDRLPSLQQHLCEGQCDRLLFIQSRRRPGQNIRDSQWFGGKCHLGTTPSLERFTLARTDSVDRASQSQKIHRSRPTRVFNTRCCTALEAPTIPMTSDLATTPAHFSLTQRR